MVLGLLFPPQALVVCSKEEKGAAETMSLHQHGKLMMENNGRSAFGCKAYCKFGSDGYVDYVL